MNTFVYRDFLVLSAALRAIYHRVRNAQDIDTQELEAITTGLVSLVGTLIQWVNRTFIEPPEEQFSLAMKETFKDAIALIWQITWLLAQKNLDTNALREQLQLLHLKLESYN